MLLSPNTVLFLNFIFNLTNIFISNIRSIIPLLQKVKEQEVEREREGEGGWAWREEL